MSDAGAGAWIRSRQAVWNRWLSAARSQPRNLTVSEAQHYVEDYRLLASDLATARRLLPGSTTTRALAMLYARSHAAINASARTYLSTLRTLFRRRVPAAMAVLAPIVLWIGLLLALSAGAGWWLVDRYPELTSLVASHEMIQRVEHGELWTEGILNVAPSSVVSLRILSNNIVVSLFAFCIGIFFGLGAFYITALNGFMLGALFAFTHHHGLDGELLKFIAAHGPVELSVMCIAAAAGTAIGEALIRPDAPTRRESLQRATDAVAPALLACALLLVGCGIIEGYVSPRAAVPLPVRATIGCGYFALMVLLLRGGLYPARTPELQVRL